MHFANFMPCAWGRFLLEVFAALCGGGEILTQIVGDSAAFGMAHHYTHTYLGFSSRLASHICGATRCHIMDVFPSWKPADVCGCVLDVVLFIRCWISLGDDAASDCWQASSQVSALTSSI